MLNIPIGSTGRMTKARAAQSERPKTAPTKVAGKSTEPRIKRERTRTKRITS